MSAGDAQREAANAAYKAGKFVDALAAYTAGYEATKEPVLLMNRAAANIALHRFVDALVDVAAYLKVEIAAGEAASAKALLRAATASLALAQPVAAEVLLEQAELTGDGASYGAIADGRAAAAAIRAALTAAESLPTDFTAALDATDRATLAAAETAASVLLAGVRAAPRADALLIPLARALAVSKRFTAAGDVLRVLLRGRASGVQGAVVADAPIDIMIGADHSVVVDPAAAPLETSALHQLYATVLLADGRFDQAADEVMKAVHMDPDGSTDAGRAAIALRKAIRTVHDAKEAANGVYKGGDYPGAVAAYNACIEAAKTTIGFVPAVLYGNLSAALASSGGKGAEAGAAAVAAVQRAPFNAKHWVRVATAAATGKPPQHDVACACLRAAQFVDPDDATLRSKLTTTAAKDGRGADIATEPATLRTSASGSGGSAGAAGKAAGAASSAGSSAGSSSDIAALQSIWGAPAVAAASGGSGTGGKAPVAAAASGGPSLQIVDAFATWCGPCKAIAPEYEKIAAGGAIPSFFKLDGDKHAAAVAKLGVRAYPTFIALLDGAEVDRMEGADARRLHELVGNGIGAWKAKAWGAGFGVGGPGSGAAGMERVRGVEVSPPVCSAVAEALEAIAALA